MFLREHSHILAYTELIYFLLPLMQAVVINIRIVGMQSTEFLQTTKFIAQNTPVTPVPFL